MFLPSKGDVVVLRLVGLGLGLRLLLRLGLLELGLVAVLDGVDDPMSEAVIACTANIRSRFEEHEHHCELVEWILEWNLWLRIARPRASILLLLRTQRFRCSLEVLLAAGSACRAAKILGGIRLSSSALSGPVFQ